MLREGFGEAQQPPQVRIAAIKDVAPDLVHGRICHACPRCLVGVFFRQNRGVPSAVTTALATLLSGTTKIQSGQVLFLTRG